MEGQCPPFVAFRDAVIMRAGREILRIDDLSLAQGESVAILGPNGAGKSTFVQMMTREVLPLHRDLPPVLFLGDARATLEEVRRHIGVVSSTMQSQISVHLPAIQIVEGGFFGALGIPLRKHVTPEQEHAARTIMQELGIADLEDRDVMTLSSGQARRVLIARALVHNPEALIADEPCAGLDPRGMYHIRKTMRRISQSGRSLTLVTHFLEDITPEIDRVILIKDGHVLKDGSKRETLTSEMISELFDCDLAVERKGEYYTLKMEF